jgi:hypothetical protein
VGSKPSNVDTLNKWRGEVGTRRRINGEHERILTILARFRAASASQLHRLRGHNGCAERTTRRFVTQLADEGFTKSITLPRKRIVYRLTKRGVRASDAVAERVPLRSPATITLETAIACWQRAALWLHFEGQGYTVGCDYDAFLAVVDAYRQRLAQVSDPLLRSRFAAVLRSLLRNLPSRSPWRCGCCGFVSAEREQEHQLPPEKGSRLCRGQLYRSDYLLYDVAYRPGEVIFLVADNPNRRILSLLEQLPVQVAVRSVGQYCEPVSYLQPRFPVIFVPAVDGSLWSADEQAWALRGTRLRGWHGYLLGTTKGTFPYSRVLQVQDPPSSAVFDNVVKRECYAYGVSL